MTNVLDFVMNTLAAINNNDMTAQEFCAGYKVFHHEWETLAFGALTRLACWACDDIGIEDLDTAVTAALKAEVAELSPRERVVGDINAIMGFVAFRGSEQYLLRKERLGQMAAATAEMDASTKAAVEAYDKAFEARSETLRKGRGASGGYTNNSRQRRWRLGPDALRSMGLEPTENNLRWLRQEIYEAQEIFKAHGLR